MNNGKNHFFHKLINYLIMKFPFYYNLNLMKLSESFEKKFVYKIFINLENIKEYYKIDKKDLFKLLYFNRKILYFYLNLLITENSNIINYCYSTDFIKQIDSYNNKNNNNLIKKLIISKIIVDLIEYYKGFDVFNITEKIEIKNINIIQDNIDIFKKLSLDLDFEYFKSKSIDVIYAKIIKEMILKKKIKDYEYVINIVNQLDLESIEITHKIFNEIDDIFNDERNINEYLISKEEDLIKEEIINFYYIILKYILKNSLFIYLPKSKFLATARKNIINLIRKKSELFNLKIEGNIRERLSYIIENIDSKYYLQNYNEVKKTTENTYEKKTAKESSYIIALSQSESKSKRKNNYSSSKESGRRSILHGESSLITYSFESSKKKSSENSESYYDRRSKFIKIIGEHHNSDDERKKYRNTADYIVQIKDYYLSFGTNRILNVYNKFYEKKNQIQFKDYIFKIYEDDILGEEIRILACSRNKIYYCTNIINNKKVLDSKLDIKPNLLFLIKKEDDYFACYEKEVLIYNKSKIIKKSSNIIISQFSKSGIFIDDDYIIFKSTKIVINELILYNIKHKVEVYITIQYSLIYSSDGLALNKNHILLCACKKYTKKQKNGILLINFKDILNNINFDKFFYDTKNFEVYCFCWLLKIKKDNKVNILNNNSAKSEFSKYFLVGGFNKDKNQGLIKLYKLVYTDEFNDIKSEYIHDINIMNSLNKNFKGFNGPISSIIQSNIDGNILITCWDGNVYLFSGENLINFYENEEYEDSFNKFFKE